MIKVVATDIDGTITGDGSSRLHPDYYQAVNQLSDLGIQVIVATGRHTDSAVNLFEPVKDKLIYICDNGAATGRLGETFREEIIPQQIYLELLDESLQLEGCEILITTGGLSYMPLHASDAFERLMRDEYHFNAVRCEHLEEITGVIKFSIYHTDRIREQAGHMIGEWENRLYGVIAGACWIDFMMPQVTKGNCLERWLQELGVQPQECAAFGDQENDIGMLTLAGHSFAVEAAAPACVRAADTVIPGPQKNGVLGIWKQIIEQKGDWK